METEKQLLESIRKGDRLAMRRLYDRFSGYAMAVGLRYIADREDVKDVVQDCFVSILTAVSRFEYRGEGSLKSWVSLLWPSAVEVPPVASVPVAQSVVQVAQESTLTSQGVRHAVRSQPFSVPEPLRGDTLVINDPLPTVEEKTEQTVPSSQQTRQAPDPLQVVRQLDEQIAAISSRQRPGRISFSLYASNGFGNQTGTSGVLMSDELLARYDYDRYMPAARERAGARELVYLSNYEEHRKFYQPVTYGLTTNIPISSRLSVVTGVTYTRLKSDFSNVMNGFAMTQKQTLYYVGVPLALQYQLWQRGGLHVYATAGGQADLNVKADLKAEGVQLDCRRDRLQWSVQAAVGIQYNVIRPLGIYVEPGVKYYFDNGSRVQNFFKDKPANFNLQLGLRLNLGND